MVVRENQIEESETKFQESLNDRIVLARFVAVCLIGIAIINLIPVGFSLRQLLADDSLVPARWVYLQSFAAMVFAVYGLFLIQVADWSALRAVSWFLLLIAMALGLLAAGLITGDKSGIAAQLLQLPPWLFRAAGLWCAALLCATTLLSFLGGRESRRWQRSETLLLSLRERQQSAL